MFTGIIEKVVQVEKINFSESGAKISFFADFSDTKKGDSIAVNGVCLTVCEINKNLFSMDIMKQTLNTTSLRHLKKGDFINLERALKIDSRLDGHIVSGHIDNIGEVISIKTDGFSKRVKIKADTDLIISKGSIALNGTSLTVSQLENDSFEVCLIPETIKNTNLENLKVGDIVNIEYDLFAKYIKKFINKDERKDITIEFLKENGF